MITVIVFGLLMLSGMQPTPNAGPEAKKEATVQPAAIESADRTAGREAEPADLGSVIPQLTRWLGFEVATDQLKNLRLVNSTDGRWPFGSLVSADHPAWLADLKAISIELAPDRKTPAMELTVLLRQEDSALLGIRAKWLHEDQGVQVFPKLEKEYREDLAGESECWSGVGTGAKSNLRAVLAHICGSFGGPLSCDYLTACVISPHEVCPGGATLCARPELGPVWSIELASLLSPKQGHSLAFGMDMPNQRGRQAKLIVSHIRHVVIDSPLGSGCSGTWPRPVVTITTQDGKTEQRNWYDETHAPPFGFVEKKADPVTDAPPLKANDSSVPSNSK
jgi:hypothetical protein